MSKAGKISSLTCSCLCGAGPSFILVAGEELWMRAPLTLGCWQLLGDHVGFGNGAEAGEGGALSLFVLHEAQLCGGLNLVALLSRVIVQGVNKAFSSQHCLAGIIPPWSDSKAKKKK